MEMSLLCQRRGIIKSRRFLVSDALTFGLVVGVFVGSTAGYLGSIMVSKHMALVGDALYVATARRLYLIAAKP